MLRGKICNADEDYTVFGRGRKRKVRGEVM